MTPTRLMTLLVAVAAAGPAAAQAPDPTRPKVVVRVSRAFVENLTSRTFDDVSPVATTQKGATIVGTSRLSGGFTVAFHKSPTEAAFDIRADGTVDTDLGVTRRPVCVALDGHAGFCAARRITFDGDTYAGGPVGVEANYASTLEGIGTLRRGPFAPVIRRVARPVVLGSLPEADRAAAAEVRARARDKMTEKTDRVVAILNAVHDVNAEVIQKLRDRDLVPDKGRPVLATTDDALLGGLGFPEGSPLALPAAAGGPSGPVEIWVYRPLSPAQRVLLDRILAEAKEKWGKDVKPRFVAEVARHSPDLARRAENATHEVTIDVPGAPGWHRIRFFRDLHDAAPPAP
ncbi:MAG TPA: hypothetical protein VD866_22535 [Urbifossiella sp.]|nr:hypothetical protein [Urbifossiella sp.]